MATDSRAISVPSPIVAICGWLVPGAGYLLIGQMGRALWIGITIILLFLSGLLIAGVRVIEVPGMNSETGEKQMVRMQLVDPVTRRPVLDSNNRPRWVERWSLEVSVLGEIRDKPWSVPQVLAGPIAIIAGACSIEASKTGAISHARVNEIGSLYLSVAGLLNLMAIIDSTWRASHLREKQESLA